VLQNRFSPSNSPPALPQAMRIVFFEARKSYDFLASHIDPHFSP
ncbi:MAG: hypothetical protein ACI9LN_004146, partial [Saprospiraceae bacterium]